MNIIDMENMTSSMPHQQRIEGAKNVASRAALGSGFQRRPLGVVNFHSEKKATQQSVMKPQMLESKAPGKNPNKSGGHERRSSTKPTPMTCSMPPNDPRTPPEDPEMENMILCPDVDEDDFHDLWPVSGQPSTFLKNMMSWCPPVYSECCDYDELPISPPSVEMLEGTDDEAASFDLANGGKPVHESLPPPHVLDFDLLSLSLPPIDEDLEYLSCLN